MLLCVFPVVPQTISLFLYMLGPFSCFKREKKTLQKQNQEDAIESSRELEGSMAEVVSNGSSAGL